MVTAASDLRYDAVLFDVGGTLIGFHAREPFQAFLRQVSLPDSEREAGLFHRRFVNIVHASREEAMGLGADGDALEAWWESVFARTWPDEPDVAQEMGHWFKAGCFQQVFHDALPTLEALGNRGLLLGIVSNFPPDLEQLLVRLGLRDFFRFVIASSLAGAAKPDPEIFDLAVTKTGVSRRRTLYVGDHFGDDIEGAWNAGLDPVLIDRGNQHAEAACPRIGSLVDLLPYVQVPGGDTKAIIFDMDGVVLDSPPTHLVTWQRTLAPLGVELTAGDFFPLEGMPTEVTARRLIEVHLGVACSDEEASRLAGQKRALFRQIFEPRYVPGIVPLLYDLHGRGYRLGLVTGSAQSLVDDYVASSSLRHLFHAIVTGDDVEQGKPAPEPSLAIAQRLGTAPKRCVVVENAPLGIRSARAAGMRCVALETTLPAAQLPGANHVFSDVPALRSWLLSRWRAALRSAAS
jgi:beta-phosphoglucomutase